VVDKALTVLVGDFVEVEVEVEGEELVGARATEVGVPQAPRTRAASPQTRTQATPRRTRIRRDTVCRYPVAKGATPIVLDRPRGGYRRVR
jgi:hypothetical protein